MIRNKKALRIISLFLLVNFLMDIFSPAMVWALTAGPNSPEFSSFEPVATTDMVNIFSGDFTYNLPVLNIPGPDGSGYALSLSYHSGVSSEEEASWVGFGWTLNPGAINRFVRGFPDDYKPKDANDHNVTQYNKVKPNWTASVKEDIGLEAFGVDVGIGQAIRFNNYQGLNKSASYSLGYKGMASLNLNRSGGETTFNIGINPAAILNALMSKSKDQDEKSPKKGMDKWKPQSYAGRLLKHNVEANINKAKSDVNSALSTFTSSYGLYSFSNFTSPVSVTKYEGASYNWSKSLQINAYPPVGVEVGYSGNFNIQANVESSPMNAYGYMYNPNRTDYPEEGDANILSDYYVEKGSSYDKRDYFLGMPFNNADNYMVTGEGLSGGFRLYHTGVGHFYPNFVTSEMKIRQMALEFMVGQNIGIGFDFGVGNQKLKMRDWKKPDSSPSVVQFGSDDGFFRFNNDLGGNIEYTTDANTVGSATLSANTNLPGLVKHFPNLADIGLQSISPYGSGSSSFITKTKYNSSGNIALGDRIEKGINVTGPENGVAEIAVYNESGIRYVYGLPVYSENEKSFQIGINHTGINSASIDRNYLAYQNVYVANPLDNTIITGEVKDKKYATNYLLTQINTADYVDVGNDGADEKDFGGWTKFAYRKAMGDYHFRTPYNGLLYQKNQISDKRDDMGSLSMGDKEVYYLKAIETKTHIAFFITNKTVAGDFSGYNITDAGILNSLNGSGISRPDGIGAAKVTGATDPAAGSSLAKGNQEVEKLERIILFSKNRFDRPLQTTNFQYDNSLVRNLPNNINYPASSNSQQYLQSGKLTLKRVWFENEGVVSSKISPYQFIYEYKKSYPAAIAARYPTLVAGINGYSDSDENPDYQPHALDMWGNYQAGGDERNKNMIPWVSQKDKDADFDPAAWQLKQIILPSGGQMHIQYEQKDYRYVQDRNAMAMVSLLTQSVDAVDYKPDNTLFYLNLDDLGIKKTDADYMTRVVELKNKLQDFFVGSSDELIQEKKEKIYFKFLYALVPGGGQLDNCKSEYITGYTTVNKVDLDLNNDLYLRLGSVKSSDGTTSFLQTFINDPDRTNIPRQICHDYVVANRDGFLDNNSCQEDNLEKYDDDIVSYLAGSGDLHTKITSSHIKKEVGKEILKDMGPGKGYLKHKTPRKDDVCKFFNPSLSYLRIPMTKAKKGGGVRVKRLLMFDPGIETGDANVYGSEYLYVDEDGSSSGVAVNEPAAGREENALVTFFPRLKKSFIAKIISGKDKEQAEGPLGESLLPAASVGHSRVVVRNIHSGKTGTGFQVHRFWTAKDYPFDRDYSFPNSEIAGKGVEYTRLKGREHKKRDWMKLPAGLFNFSTDKHWLTQGFRFIINNMHGQPISVSTYGGEYVPFLSTSVSKPYYLSTSTEYEYYQPGEKIPMLKFNNSTLPGQFELTSAIPGKEEDITMEMKSIHDRTIDMSLELDISITISWFPPFFITVCPSFSYSEQELNTHVTTKVLRYPSIVKKTTNYQDGIYHTTENLAFNNDNGQAVLTKTTDGYDKLKLDPSVGTNTNPHDGGYYAMSIPGSWMYPELGQKASDGQNTNQLNVNVGNFTTYGDGANPLDKFTSGVWNPYNSATAPTNVISASAQQYEKNWFNDVSSSSLIASIAGEYGITDGGAEQAELNNKWHQKNNFVYKTGIELANANASEPDNRVYNAGIYKGFNFFDWTASAQTPGSNGEWVKLNEVLKYSPNGQAVEDVNILGIHSAARFGYNHTLPVVVAQNSTYESVQFEDFENKTQDVSGYGHSGKKSLSYNVNPTYKFVSSQDNQVKLDQQLLTKGALIKVWIKSSFADGTLVNNKANLQAVINNTLYKPFTKVAQTGEWSLYEAKITEWGGLTSGTPLDIALAYGIDNAHNEAVYMDDFRFQPLDAQAVCYVYDVKSQRLITQFDDQHFGVFYQYNDEGKLVRKMIETERGMKTIQESQYNTPRVKK